MLNANGEALSDADSKFLPEQAAAFHGQQHHAVHESSSYHDGAVPNKGDGDEHDRRVLGGFKA